MSKEDVLNKAMQIVNQREKTYGKSCDNFQKAADLINAVLKDKLKDEHFISSTDVIFIMLQIKISRLINDLSISKNNKENFIKYIHKLSKRPN